MKLLAIMIVTLLLAIGSLTLLAWIGAQDSRTAKEHRLRVTAQVLSILVPIVLIWLVSTCLFLIPDIRGSSNYLTQSSAVSVANPLERSVMLHGALQQKSCKASPFRSWFVLPQEHEQENQNLHHLLVAQADLYCQFQHGNSLVYAGSAANWLTVGYLLHAVAWRGSWLTANGLDRRLWL